MGRKAFSLIELLVVITIIAILVALLLPGLSGAMARARQIRCLSNCQQAAEALSAYAGEYRGTFPMMPVPAALSVKSNQHIYGGLAGLFSLEQRGDDGHVGYGAIPGGGAYSNGEREPLMRKYVTSLGALTCPSDREDRYYGNPYSPTNATSYANAVAIRPTPCAKDQDVVTYNLSYVYFTGQTNTGNFAVALWADECNGPDLYELAWYGDGTTPTGGTTANSAAAGAAGVGSYSKVDNHGVGGGNVAYSDGSGRFSSSQSGVQRNGTGIID